MPQEKDKENATISLLFKSLFHKRGRKTIKHLSQETILVQRGGVWSDKSVPQLEGTALFSCPPKQFHNPGLVRIEGKDRPPECPLSSLGIPFSASFRPLARSGGLGLVPTSTTSEWGWGGQPRPAWPLTLEDSLPAVPRTTGY